MGLNNIFSVAASSPTIVAPTHRYLEPNGQATHMKTPPPHHHPHTFVPSHHFGNLATQHNTWG